MALGGCPMISRQNLPASGSGRRPASSSTTGRSLMTRSARYRASSAQPLPEPSMTSADVQIADSYPGARGIRQLRNALYPADGGAASMWVGPNGRSASSMTANNIGQTRTAMPRISSGWNTLPHKAGSSCESAHGSCDTTARKSSRTSDARARSVLVEALAGLLAELACLDHPQQERRRAVVRLLEFLKHLVCDQFQRVQPDEVRQPQRSHRMRQAGDHRLVDTLDRRETGFHHPDGRQQIRHQQCIDHKTGPVAAANHLLAQHVARELLG